MGKPSFYNRRPWSCLRCGVRRLQREPVCALCSGAPDLRPWSLRDGALQSVALWLLGPVLWLVDVRSRARRAKR